MGDAALERGDFGGAASAYAAALSKNPNDANAELGVGTIELYLNHLDAARTHLQRALDLSADPRARRRLAAIRQRTGGPGDYKIAFSVAEARVPLVAIDPLPTLRAKINGHSVTLVIDTGAAGIDLTAAAAARLHIATKVAGEGVFAGGQKAQVRVAQIERLDVPGLTVRGIASNVIEGGMPGADGFVGTGFLYHFLASIDYAHGALVLRPASAAAQFLATQKAAGAATVPMWLVGDHFIFARAHVNGAPDALFNIDTGGSGLGVQLTKAALDAAGITPDASHPQAFRGGAGTSHVLPFTAASVTMGAVTMRNLPGVYFPDGDQYGIFPFSVAGTISHEFFRHTILTFDFQSMNLIVSPQSLADALSAVTRTLRNEEVPGAQVIFLLHGRVSLEANYGLRDVARGAPVDAQTRFPVGSITKQFTAAAILQLKEEKKLSLDDRLGTYVPQFIAARNVTIRQLLNQTSGIPNYMQSKGFERISMTRRGSAQNAIALIADKELAFRPGTKWAYSNSNYLLLGRILEIVAHEPWEQYVRTHIFAPARMTHSTFDDAESGVRNIATGYSLRANRQPQKEPPLRTWGLGAGSIVSTAEDLARWDGAFFSGRIVSPADIKLATSPGHLDDGSATAYGFGWGVDRRDGVQRIWHNGATPGFLAMNATYPALDERVIVLLNSWNGDVDAVVDKTMVAMNPAMEGQQNAPAPGEDKAITARIEIFWRGLHSGHADRSQMTSQLSKFLTPQLLAMSRKNFAQLHPGPLQKFIYKGKTRDGASTTYVYRLVFENAILNLLVDMTRDGKIDAITSSPG